MPTLFVGNFDFEHELAGAQPASLPGGLCRINDELSFAWLAIARDGDAILGPAELEDGFLDRAVESGLPRVRMVDRRSDVAGSLRQLAPISTWSLQPWGASASIASLSRQLGISSAGRRAEIVTTANSRRFSFLLESELGVGLEGAAIVTDIEILTDRLSSLSDDARWVVKAELGMSARERILGTGRRLADASAQWVRKRIARDGAVYFEPWLERLDEAGLQFHVPESGEPQLLGMTGLMTDPTGAYCGSRFDDDPVLTAAYFPAVEFARQAAGRLQQRGYHGPLGIDAMRYRRADGSIGLRPLQDINARLTMGRLSLGLRRILRPGEVGLWRHARWNRDATRTPSQVFEDFVALLPDSVRCVRMSPFKVHDTPTQLGLLILLGPPEFIPSRLPGA